MMPKPLVSIIIPALNAAPWIAETVTSCLNQTWKPLEIIVIDNGSTDGTKDIVRSMDRSRVQLFECPTRGASAARNMGTAISKGDYIQYLDADDVLAPTKIEAQLQRLLDRSDEPIASGPWVRFSKVLQEQVIFPEAIWRDLSPDQFLITSWSGGGMMPIFGWLTPRQLIDRAGLWDETLSLNDDGEFFTRVVLTSTQVCFCTDAMGYYRTIPASTLSKRTSRAALQSYLSSIHLCTKHLLKVRDDEGSRKACSFMYQRFAYTAYRYEPDLAEEAERKVKELGGCDLAYPGGKLFQLLSAMIGWKRATRLRHIRTHH